MEAVKSLNEPTGSHKSSISNYIEVATELSPPPVIVFVVFYRIMSNTACSFYYLSVKDFR